MDEEYRINLKEKIVELVSIQGLQDVGSNVPRPHLATFTITNTKDEIDAVALCSDGKLHNSYGPAVEYSDHVVEWWVNGVEITDKIQEWLKTMPHYSQWTNKEVLLFCLKWT